MPLPPPQPLAMLECSLLRVQPSLAALSHVTDLLTAFLDPSQVISLARAAASGSLRLLERVLARVQADPNVDPVLVTYWLGLAMAAAIDLVMVQKIHSLHPSPLVVRSLNVAVRFSGLEMVQWIVDNRRDGRCCVEGIENLCPRCAQLALRQRLLRQDTWSVVEWLVREGVLDMTDRKTIKFVEKSLPVNVALLRWCHENKYVSDATLASLLSNAIQFGPPEAIESVKYLVDQPILLEERQILTSIVHGACRSGMEDVVDAVLSSHLCNFLQDKYVFQPTRPGGRKVIQWDVSYIDSCSLLSGGQQLGRAVAQSAVRYCHLDTLRWISNILPSQDLIATYGRESEDEEELLRLYEWMKSNGRANFTGSELRSAANNGQLKAVQWLHSHARDLTALSMLHGAAKNGHLHILKWFYYNRGESCNFDDAEEAAENGHLHVVQ